MWPNHTTPPLISKYTGLIHLCCHIYSVLYQTESSRERKKNFHACKEWGLKNIAPQMSARGDQTAEYNEQRIRLCSRHYCPPEQSQFVDLVLQSISSFLRTQRHLQDLTTMLESCSTRGVRPTKYIMVRGSRS